MKLVLCILICAVSLNAALGTCPVPPSGYEEGVTLTVPSSYISTDKSGVQMIFSTASQGTDDALEDILAGLSGVTPYFLVTNTAGGSILFAQIEVGIDTSAVWTAGFKMTFDDADGGRVCVYVDTNESESDLSDASSTGGFQGWDLVYIGGSTVNWANSGSNALTGTNSPTAGTSGPFHGSWTYNGTNNYHTAGASGSGDEFENDRYGAIAVLESSVATDADTNVRFALGRGTGLTSATGPTFSWTNTGATTRNEWQPPCGAAGCSVNTIAADTLAVIGITQDRSDTGTANQSLAWRNGVGSLSAWNFTPTLTDVTDDFHFGQRGSDTHYWPGTLYAFLYGPIVYDAATFNPMASMATEPDDFWVVTEIATAQSDPKPPPIFILWGSTRNPSNSSGLCGGGETALGEGCVSYDYNLGTLLGDGR